MDAWNLKSPGRGQYVEALLLGSLPPAGDHNCRGLCEPPAPRRKEELLKVGRWLEGAVWEDTGQNNSKGKGSVQRKRLERWKALILLHSVSHDLLLRT